MTPSTWAEDKLAKAVTGYHWNGRRRKSTVTLPSIAAKLLLNEHARSVRICRQARMLKFHDLRDTDTNEWLDGYEAACNDILTALQRGRGGK